MGVARIMSVRSFPEIPDHKLFKRIGTGAYGEVWLAQSALGTWRAVKVVRRDRFPEERPYEREKEGIRRFEPISRTHENLIDILQFGQLNGEVGFFYVMELADSMAPETAGAADVPLHENTYHPRTLRAELLARDSLPFDECVRLGLALAGAIDHLHRAGLIHRDVKPSNIIYVNGVPKLADIGLVTGRDEAESVVGTRGYLAPEGPNTPQADVFSLGRVLYECSTGKDSQHYPEPRTDLGQLDDRTRWLELHSVIEKACDPSPELRYHSGAEMRAELALLATDGALREARRRERLIQKLKRLSWVASLTILVAAVLLWLERQHSNEVEQAHLESHRHLHELITGNGVRLMDLGSHAESALWFAEALLHSDGDPVRERTHQRQLQAVLSRCARLVAIGTHKDSIRAIQFSPDGRVFATASADGSVKFWEALTGAPNSITLEQPGSVEGLQFSPDGRWLVTWGKNEFIRLWNVESGALRFSAISNNSPVGCVRFAPNGQYICSGGEDGMVRTWDVATGSPMRFTAKHDGAINDISFSTAGDLLVTSGDDNVARIWDLSNGDNVGADLRHDDDVRSANFSADGTRVVTASKDGTVRMWNVSSAQVASAPLKLEVPLWVGQFSPDDRWVLGAGGDGMQGGRARIWDSVTGRPRTPILIHNNAIRSACFSPNGRFVATASHDHSVILWDAETGARMGAPLRGTRPFKWVTFSPDGTHLLAAGEETVWRYWDLRPLLEGESPKVMLPYVFSRYSPDGRSILGVRSNGSSELIDATNFQLRTHFDAPAASLVWANFSADGRKVSSLRRDGSIWVWEAATGKPIVASMTNSIGVDGDGESAFSPDGRLMAVMEGGNETVAKVWDVEAGGKLRFELHHQYPPRSFEFSPDGTMLLVGCSRGPDEGPGETYLWSISSGQLLRGPIPWIGCVKQVCWSSNGRLYGTCGVDRSNEPHPVKIWEVTTGRRTDLPVPWHGVTTSSFGLDGTTLIVGSSEGGVRLWDAVSALPVSVVFGHDHACRFAMFSSHQDVVATSTIIHGSRLWDAHSGAPIGPLIHHPGRVSRIWLRPGQEELVICGGQGSSIWSFRPQDRAQSEWQLEAEVAAGAKLDAGGSLIQLSATELAERLARRRSPNN